MYLRYVCLADEDYINNSSDNCPIHLLVHLIIMKQVSNLRCRKMLKCIYGKRRSLICSLIEWICINEMHRMNWTTENRWFIIHKEFDNSNCIYGFFFLYIVVAVTDGNANEKGRTFTRYELHLELEIVFFTVIELFIYSTLEFNFRIEGALSYYFFYRNVAHFFLLLQLNSNRFFSLGYRKRWCVICTLFITATVTAIAF